MWNFRFEHEFVKHPGVAKEQINSFLYTWNKTLSEEEIIKVKEQQVNPFPKSSPYYDKYIPFDPAVWRLPQREFPDSYIDFLMYSNGGEFQNGDRYFQFFDTVDLREMNFVYEVPEYMPFAVSFAMDGSGNHYLFDMREEQRNNEYPILIAHSGNLGYEDCKLAANSFMELCIEKGEL